MSKNRVFSEQEASEIMQRAVRLQESSSTGEGYTPGVTMDELVRIAEEAGIDPKFLERAASGVDTEEKSTQGVFNLSEEFERVVEGEIDPEDFDQILHLVRRSGKGGMSQVGRTLTGMGYVGVHVVHVDVESRKGRTRIKVRSSPLTAYFIALHGPLIGSFLALMFNIDAGRPWLGFAIAVGLMTIGGSVFKSLINAGKRAAKKLTGQIVEVVEEEVDTLRVNLAEKGETAPAKRAEIRQDRTRD
ncbi:MAG: hypothetical protein IH944_02235 [Armatimonadetes bacterium]|nr:hypothetical protein [Armatimonadota bacterium]